MIFISGLVYRVVTVPFTDSATGEISQVSSAEILHEVRNKTEVASVKIDASVVEQWTKAIGKSILNEIRFYALKTREGGVLSGITLTDKKSLPSITPAK